MNRLYQFWVHTQLVGRLPDFIEYIFETPYQHRVHHSRVPAHLSSNYGGMFSIWDQMFGTFKLVDVDVYGLPEPVDVWIDWQGIDHYRHMWNQWRSKGMAWGELPGVLFGQSHRFKSVKEMK